MLSSVIHARYEGNDHCSKSLHNPHYKRVMYFLCNVPTFISRMNLTKVVFFIVLKNNVEASSYNVKVTAYKDKVSACNDELSACDFDDYSMYS